jgi:hypothetical protein
MDNMLASSADRKPAVLVEAQDEITIEIDRGNVILRQRDALGNDPDTIIVARRNLTAFVSDLIETALPELASAEASDVKPLNVTSPADPTAAERQRRYRARKRAGGPVSRLHREAAE